MKLFVDDERPKPDDSWYLVKNSHDALDMIYAYHYMGKTIDTISLDHDLSIYEGIEDDSRCIILYMCEHDFWPTNLYIHTANPCGEEWLVGMAKRYGPAGMIKGYGPDYWNSRR